MNRQKFLEFLGFGALGIVLPMKAIGLSRIVDSANFLKENNGLIGVKPSMEDDVILAPSLSYKTLISWGDPINEKANFGSHNDYIAFLPISDNEALLWVNHEYFDSLFVSGKLAKEDKTILEMQREMLEVGGSILKIKKVSGQWEFVPNDKSNKRIDATTKIPFSFGQKVVGTSEAMGTMANCSGGVTPWGTILTCEENYDMYYGERQEDGSISPSYYGWEKHVQNPPEHYGWVVEVDCKTGKAIKHTSMGRCAHECATVTISRSGKTVVYTGDDKENECLYKFVSNNAASLDEGTLYVANIEKGEWVSLNWEDQKILQESFSSQIEVMIHLRKAAKLVGGTPLDRPEDIEIDPNSGNVLVALSNNIPFGNYYGSILKITENEDFDALTFFSDTFLTGGEETGFACPDNLAFDPNGNLWFTTDISGSKIGKGEYTSFKNNGLFIVPREGRNAGEVIQMASAPVSAEFTGPCFSPDGKFLFLSVQHPGETTIDLEKPTSKWPNKDASLPKSSVIVVQGF